MNSGAEYGSYAHILSSHTRCKHLRVFLAIALLFPFTPVRSQEEFNAHRITK